LISNDDPTVIQVTRTFARRISLRSSARTAVHPGKGQRESGQHDVVVHIQVVQIVALGLLIHPHLPTKQKWLEPAQKYEQVQAAEVAALGLPVKPHL
jgi:hypothetical protein